MASDTAIGERCVWGGWGVGGGVCVTDRYLWTGVGAGGGGGGGSMVLVDGTGWWWRRAQSR